MSPVYRIVVVGVALLAAIASFNDYWALEIGRGLLMGLTATLGFVVVSAGLSHRFRRIFRPAAPREGR